MSSVWSFAFLWCFESLAAGAPTEEGKKEKGMQLCQPTEPNASWILPILSHFHASLAIQPRPGKWKPHNVRRSVPKIIEFAWL